MIKLIFNQGLLVDEEVKRNCLCARSSWILNQNCDMGFDAIPKQSDFYSSICFFRDLGSGVRILFFE